MGLALPAEPVHAAPIEVEVDFIGPRWAGPQYRDNLGWSVESPGDINDDGLADFAVSAPQDEGPVTFDSVLRIYMGNADGPSSAPYANWADVEISDSELGVDAVYNFQFVADATGNGALDLVVVEPNVGEAGKVILYEGNASGWPEVLTTSDARASWEGHTVDLNGDGIDEVMRPSIAAGGDLDGDGRSDIVIASGSFQRVWVHYATDGFQKSMSLADIPDSVALCDDDPSSGDFGDTMTMGDFNGDNFDDLVVGAPGCQGEQGRVFIWYGSAAALDLDNPDLELGGGDRLGGTVAVADLNNDGHQDLFVQELQSATPSDTTQEDRGNLWIYFGTPTGLPTEPDVQVWAGFSDHLFGQSIAVLPDVSNPADGLPELLIGSPLAAVDGVDQGAVYLFEGQDPWPPTLTTNDAKYLIAGSDRDAWFGWSMDTVHDFDGDGRAEVVIGEPKFTLDNTQQEIERGRFYLFTALPDRDEDNDGSSTLNGDCDDQDSSINPNRFESCDGIDNDCDHTVDEGCDEDVSEEDGTGDTSSDPFSGDGDGGCSCSSSLAHREPARPAATLALLLWLLRAHVLRRRML